VVQACNPSYSGGRGRRIKVQEQLGKRVRPYLKIKAERAGEVSHPQHHQERKKGGREGRRSSKSEVS
jgi:hypothetical protein